MIFITFGYRHRKEIIIGIIIFLGYRYYFMTDAQSSTDANASHIGAEVNLEVSDKTADWGAKYDSYGIYETTDFITINISSSIYYNIISKQVLAN